MVASTIGGAAYLVLRRCDFSVGNREPSSSARQACASPRTIGAIVRSLPTPLNSCCDLSISGIAFQLFKFKRLPCWYCAGS
jgi:hypothetical protein